MAIKINLTQADRVSATRLLIVLCSLPITSERAKIDLVKFRSAWQATNAKVVIR